MTLEVGDSQEDGHDDCGEQLQVVGRQLEPEDDANDDVVDDAADDHKGQLAEEVQVLAQQGFADDLADDDGGQADDDGTAAHVDVGKTLILCHEAAGQSNEGVGQAQGDDLGDADVDALCLTHSRVAASGTDGTALFGAEVPVKGRDDDGDEHQSDENGSGDLPGGEEQGILIHADGQVGHAHDVQVDGVQGDLGQDAGQDGRDAQEGVEQAGDETGGQTCQDGDEQGSGDGPAVEDEHHGDRAAGGEAAVYGQVSEVQQTEGDINPQGHQTPDQALRHVAGHST